MQDLWGIKLDCFLSVRTLYGAELSRRCAESAINVLFRVLVLIFSQSYFALHLSLSPSMAEYQKEAKAKAG